MREKRFLQARRGFSPQLIAPIVRAARSSASGTNLHPGRFSTAISGTTDTPKPALTMLKMLLNCPLSNTICGFRCARLQAATAVSRKQWLSRNNRNGSPLRSPSDTAEPRASGWRSGKTA